MKTKHKRKKRITIISRESNSKTIDVELLEDELRKRGLKVNSLCRLLTKDQSLKSLSYIGHMARQEHAILRSDVIILDTYCIPASMLPHRKGSSIIQMWHALGAIKKFGWQTVGKKDGSSERIAKLMRMHKNYDYVMAPSDITAGHFCEAFKVPRSAIVKLGLPRIDYIKSVSGGERSEETRKRILSRYPELREEKKRTILYAPTFRKDRGVDIESLINCLDKDKYNLVVKLHPLYRTDSSRLEGPGSEDNRCHVITDEEFSTYDWLAVSDIIISDYSSFVIEATLAEKPLYVYAYDLEEYTESTGLNIDFTSEPISAYVFRDAKELAMGLEEEYDMNLMHKFRKRYIDIETEDCTKRIADFIETLL